MFLTTVTTRRNERLCIRATVDLHGRPCRRETGDNTEPDDGAEMETSERAVQRSDPANTAPEFD